MNVGLAVLLSIPFKAMGRKSLPVVRSVGPGDSGVSVCVQLQGRVRVRCSNNKSLRDSLEIGKILLRTYSECAFESNVRIVTV